jgi:CRP-like cAMP-binding protein
METLERILREHPFFADMAEDYIHLLAECASNVRFNRGDTIFQRGQDANTFYLIRAGRVAIEIYDPSRGRMVLQTLREGDIVGWSWLVPPYKWRFDARALELTRAVALDGACLRSKCEQDHDLGYLVMKRFVQTISRRLEGVRLQVADIYGPGK